MRTISLLVWGSIFSLLTACGGGGGGSNSTATSVSPQTATGQFVDSRVEGLSYISGGQSGVTDSQGTFTYEIGANITFSIGTVTLGTVAGNEVITPVDLTGENSGTIRVRNIVRFLLMLDSDGDSSNGITLSNSVQLIAENWLAVDFSSADLDTDLIQIISDVATADSRVPVLPASGQAQVHVEDTLSCLASGVFAGTFSGQDNGTFLLWIQSQRFDPVVFGDTSPRSGVTSALVFSTDDNLVLGVTPQQGLSFNSNKQFITGLVSSGTEFSGELEDYRTIRNGIWANGITGESGGFSGERKAGKTDVVYRLSGFLNLDNQLFSADGSGIVGLDIGSDNRVTGVMVTLRGQESALAGTLDGTTISVSGGGNTLTLEFDADGSDASNDALLGTTAGFTGQWNSASGLGSVIGTSCQP